MKKPIPEIQNELVNIIGNVAMISVNQGDNLDKQSKSNAVELLKRVIRDLDEYKQDNIEVVVKMDKKEIDKITQKARYYLESNRGDEETQYIINDLIYVIFHLIDL